MTKAIKISNNFKGIQQLFQYNGNQVRTVSIDGEPWFLVKDVCDILELTNQGNAVARLDEDEKQTIRLTDTLSRNPNMTIVNEPGLYSLINRSRKPEAKVFQRWVNHEVLPSIRKTGSYSVQQLTPSEILHQMTGALVELEKKQDHQAAVLAETQRQIADLIHGLVDINEPLRSQFNTAVRTYAGTVDINFAEAYNKVYNLLSKQNGVNIRLRADRSGRKIIDILEELNLLVPGIQLTKGLLAESKAV